LDMRLICTTNVEIDNLDPAVTRDGRLCTRMEIGLLDTKMANDIYKRLTGKEGDLKEKLYRLGTVYKIAKGNGLTIEKEAPKKSVGFALGRPAVAKPSLEEMMETLDRNIETVDAIVKQRSEELVEEIEQEDDVDGEPGEVVTAINKDGEMVEVGYVSPDGKLHITDEAFLDDDEDLIDSDPEEDDANVMPDYLDMGEDDE